MKENKSDRKKEGKKAKVEMDLKEVKREAKSIKYIKKKTQEKEKKFEKSCVYAL